MRCTKTVAILNKLISKLSHKDTIEEKLSKEQAKQQKHYEKEWKEWIEPKLTTVAGMSIESLEEYQFKYFNNWYGMRSDLCNWAHYSNCFLPPLKPLKNPFVK
ncbi:hypothetical protein [Liquorilactobacillus hordei]|uniref:hypothetical protein n=1 Tax=Liquorilactobacillus hordei TaxID=468911 RepID=UPI0039E96711